MKFSGHGFRRRPDCGLYYTSDCGHYTVYHSDQLYGMAIHEERWLAIWESTQGKRVIGRHRKRSAAERRCARHGRAVAQAIKQAARMAEKRKRRRSTVRRGQLV